MRVLIVTDTYPPDINGVARTLYTLGAGLERRGHVVEVVTTVEEEGDVMNGFNPPATYACGWPKVDSPPYTGDYVLAKGKNWAAVEKDVNDRLVVIADARRKVWQDALKASKGAVEGGTATGVTGKGAKGDKHVDPKGKPKGTGKGKAG